MDLRRVVLFLSLSILCIYLYSNLVTRLYGPQRPAQVAREETPETPVREPQREEKARPAVQPAAAAPEPTEPIPAGRSVIVETDVLRAEWTTTGARLRSLGLKKYRSEVAQGSPALDLLAAVPADELPLGVEILPLGFRDTRVAYEVNRDRVILGGGSTDRIVFRGAGPGGMVIEKEIQFTGTGYPMHLAVRVTGPAGGGAETAAVELTHSLDGNGNAGGGGWFGGGSTTSPRGVIALAGRRLEQEPFEKLKSQSLDFKEPRWAGFGDRYFVTVGVPEETAAARVLAEGRDSGTTAVVRFEVPMAGTPPEARLMLYFGPKDLGILEEAAPSLSRAVDFGWFWFVALPLLSLLRAVHFVTGNYGVDIIIVSTIIKVLFLPLTRKSMVSMQEMQKLQPQMAKIREKYKDDSQQLQKEMMELYRRHHVNPLSGCLPMLLQLPVFVGLYNTLLNAIELRHAPFTLWITDLSSPERLVIGGIGIPMLAIAMGASMLVQQAMTPMAGDPMQRRIMMLMPVMFTFMFINFPSGLVLYWLVNNLLTIVQQYALVNRTAS